MLAARDAVVGRRALTGILTGACPASAADPRPVQVSDPLRGAGGRDRQGHGCSGCLLPAASQGGVLKVPPVICHSVRHFQSFDTAAPLHALAQLLQ